MADLSVLTGNIVEWAKARNLVEGATPQAQMLNRIILDNLYTAVLDD